MAEAILGFTITKFPLQNSSSPASKLHFNPLLRQCSTSTLLNGWQQHRHQVQGMKVSKRGSLSKAKAFPDWPLMAVLVDHLDGQKDLVTHKSIWHLSDQVIKNVYVFYIMFTCWGCLVFGSTKDPFYDSDAYRGEGGDGTGHWIYDKQEDMEEAARAELWREELIEEIEQKVGGLRELEDAIRK
ncbi:NDH dependent flow 6 [Euphorbia peplus]|nr:NDH dependent flow 6 [Euphorbia peplus]